MENEVTVVVPAYNASRSIEKCMTSLLNQTIIPFIIVVNDGSHDNTRQKLRKYENLINVLVIDEPNQGVSAARNKGIENCKTKYITFVDPDDHVDRNYISTLVNNFNSIDEVDMSICNFQSDLNGKAVRKCQFDNGIFNNFTIISKLFLLDSITGSVCNKLFKMSKIEKYDLKFSQTLSISEDLKFCFDYLKECKGKIITNNKVCYYYHVGDNGLSSNIRLGTNNQRSMLIQINLLLGFLSDPIVKKYEKIEQNIRGLITVTCVNLIRGLASNDSENKLYAYRLIKKNISFLLNNREFNNKEKIKAIMSLKFGRILSLYDWIKYKY